MPQLKVLEAGRQRTEVSLFSCFIVMLLESTTVALSPCCNYSPTSLEPGIARVLSAVGGLEQPAGLQVLLKPNLISAKKGSLPCTEAAFILAVARWFVDNGARVTVGDSPAFGAATNILDKLGVLEELRSLGVIVTDFTTTRKLMLPSGVEAAVAVDALDCDLLVNLPRVKAHAQTRVTMAVKNCFGCLSGLQKPWWHMVHGGGTGRFVDLLVELLAVLPKTLTLIDGIRAMHETGPINGKSFSLNIIAGGMNPVAVDSALLSVLGIPPAHSPLGQAAVRAGIPGSLMEQLSFPLSTPEQLRVQNFLVPEGLNPIRFNPFTFIRSFFRRVLMFRKAKNL